MKKTVRILSVLFLIAMLVFSFVSCEGLDLTLEDILSGKPIILGHVHDYVIENTDAEYFKSDVSCTSGKVYFKSCECGKAGEETFTVGEGTGHSYTETEVEPTCVSVGGTKHYCPSCGDVYMTNEIPAIPHSFTNYIANGDATCTEDGTKTAKCDYNCGKTDTTVDVGSAGHVWIDGKCGSCGKTQFSQGLIFRENADNTVSVVGIGTCTDTVITIPALYREKSVTKIEEGAFKNATFVLEFDLPDSIVEIGHEAFMGCSGIKRIELKNRVYSIGTAAFSGCTNLELAILGTAVEGIYDMAFANCPKLEIVIMNGGSPLGVGSNVFYGCSNFKYILSGQSIGRWNTQYWNESWTGGVPEIIICYGGSWSFTDDEGAKLGVAVWGDWHVYQNATCESEGIERRYAQNADDVYEERPISPTGHKCERRQAKQPTCAEVGWYDYEFCTKCDYTTYEEIPTVAHETVTYYAKDATCTEDGHNEHVECENCDYSTIVVIPATGHSYENDTCTVCGAERSYEQDGNYLYFGEYPQTLKAENVLILDSTDDRGYYLGDDGNYYAKMTAVNNVGFDNPGFKFSNGSYVSYGEVYYFKVEPIRWKIIGENGVRSFLVADMAIEAMKYTAYGNPSYAESKVRRWLIGDFLNECFTDNERKLMCTTMVDNSAESTGYDSNPYVCENTFDKIFLLSHAEVTNTEYFPDHASLRRNPTDYTVARGIFVEGNGSCDWFSRSAYYGSQWASPNVNLVSSYGYIDAAYRDFSAVPNVDGVVPAMWVVL